jgi:hypothetical protein
MLDACCRKKVAVNMKSNVLNVAAKLKQSSIFFYIHTKYLSTVKTNCPKATEEKVRSCN